jgi:hypothetical protein
MSLRLDCFVSYRTPVAGQGKARGPDYECLTILSAGAAQRFSGEQLYGLLEAAALLDTSGK